MYLIANVMSTIATIASRTIVAMGWEDSDALKWYQNFVAQFLYMIVAGDTGEAENYLKFDATDALAMNGIWDYFSGLGVILVVIYFLVDWSKTTMEQRGDFTLQSMFFPLFKMCAGLAVIAQGKELVSGFLGFNNAVVDWVGANPIFGEGDSYDPSILRDTLIDVTSALGLLQSLVIIILGMILFILSRLCYLVIMYQGVSRKIEMILRGGFMPIAIGDIYKGLDSNGVRYAKKFLALCVWGFAMMAVIQIGNAIALANISRIINTDTTGVFAIVIGVSTCLIFPLAEAGMVSASKQLCCDAFGC